jgi:hypothetical protein
VSPNSPPLPLGDAPPPGRSFAEGPAPLPRSRRRCRFSRATGSRATSTGSWRQVAVSLTLGSRVSLRAAAKEKFPSPTNRRRRGAMASTGSPLAFSMALISYVTSFAPVGLVLHRRWLMTYSLRPVVLTNSLTSRPRVDNHEYEFKIPPPPSPIPSPSHASRRSKCSQKGQG